MGQKKHQGKHLFPVETTLHTKDGRIIGNAVVIGHEGKINIIKPNNANPCRFTDEEITECFYVENSDLSKTFVTCTHCVHGYTKSRHRLKSIVTLILISGTEHLTGKTHHYIKHISEGVYGFSIEPSKDILELCSGLTGKSYKSKMGHGSTDVWKVENKIIAAAGLDPETWGICEHCNQD